jgi:hypothetical protein
MKARGAPKTRRQRGFGAHARSTARRGLEGIGIALPRGVTTPPTTAQAPASEAANDAGLSALDRRWLWRVPLLLWLGWTGWRYLADPEYGSIFSGIIFGSHEFGHLFFAPFGELLMVAGGSLMQLLVPLGVGALLLARRDWYGTAVAGCWLSFSLSNLAVYIGDAVAQELPLVSFSPDGGEHDWYYLLNRFNLLSYDLHIAMLTRRLAFAVLAASFIGGLWISLRGARPEGAEP